jgi:hypothetical protein
MDFYDLHKFFAVCKTSGVPTQINMEGDQFVFFQILGASDKVNCRYIYFSNPRLPYAVQETGFR